MSSKPSHIKLAERNALELVREIGQAMKFLDGMAAFGNTVTHEYIGRNEYFEGLAKIRSAIYAEYVYAISRVTPFAWQDGSDAQKFAKKFMRERLGGEFEIASFLERWCRLPGAYSVEAVDGLKAEVEEALGDTPK
jgi:hypothetical protein